MLERRGDYVRLDDDGYVKDAKPRLGAAFHSSLTVKSFTTIISSRARWTARLGLLEAHALVLALGWLTRSAARHARPPVIIVHDRAVIGAFTKSRSSARSLRMVLRTAAARQVAALPKLLYVPAVWNPADRPARGRHWRPPPPCRTAKHDTTSKRCRRPRFGTATERRLMKVLHAFAKLEADSGTDFLIGLLGYLG